VRGNPKKENTMKKLKHTQSRPVLSCGISAMLLASQALVQAAQPAAQSPAKYEPTVESLRQA
jgi:hypothetical protein